MQSKGKNKLRVINLVQRSDSRSLHVDTDCAEQRDDAETSKYACSRCEREFEDVAVVLAKST